MNLIVNNIYSLICDVLPKKWNKVIFYDFTFESGRYSTKFYVNKKNVYIDCFSLSNSNSEIMDKLSKIHEEFNIIKQSNSEKCNSCTLIINNDGKYNLSFDYYQIDDANMNWLIDWKKKNLV